MDAAIVSLNQRVETNVKINILNSAGFIENIIICGGGGGGDGDGGSGGDGDDTKIIYTDIKILQDDSIYSIKNKILFELSTKLQQNIAYQELYLFSKKPLSLSVENIYTNITKHEMVVLTRQRLKQFLLNMGVSAAEIESFLEKFAEQNVVSYLEFKEIYEKIKRRWFYSPIGQHQSNNADNYIFSANPYLLATAPAGDFEVPKFVCYENELLLNYSFSHIGVGEGFVAEIYVCLATNVVEHFRGEDGDNGVDEYLFKNYFPHLYLEGIHTIDDYENEENTVVKLRKESRHNISAKSMLFHKSVQLFHDIHEKYSHKDPLKYIRHGIRSCNFKIKSNIKNILPLDVIFKNIHSQKNIPFIKYNPGNKRENIYRLYTEQKTKDGKYIPILPENTVLSLSKTIGKSKQISLYINSDIIPFYINFEINGDVQIIIADIKTPITTDELTEFIIKNVNPVIENINSILQQTGYSINVFKSFEDKTVCSIIYINYTIEYELQKLLTIKDFYNFKCISSILDIITPRKTEDTKIDEIKMVYKRVENFKETEAQNALIYETYKNTNNIREVIEALIQNYKIERESAELQVANYFGQHADIRGKLIDNPGFPVSFKIGKFDTILTIDVEKIIDFSYINIISVYFDSILRITQFPKLINKKDLDICSKKIEERLSTFNSSSDSLIASSSSATPAEKNAIYTSILKKDDDGDDFGDLGLFQNDDDDDDNGDNAGLYNDNDDAGNLGLFFDDDDDDNDDANNNIKFSAELNNKNKNQSISKSVAEYELMGISGGGGNGSGDGDADKEKHAERIQKIIGKPLKNPNIFYEKMKKADPALFISQEGKNYEGYSRICQANIDIQPVVLNKQEFDKINNESPESYKDYIKYGTEPDQENYYICPRYWCLLSNTSMTEEDVKQGKCARRGEPDKIIPRSAKKVPHDAFVYEFANEKEHFNKEGEYVQHYPGFKVGKHPKGFGLPCCFKKPKQNYQILDTKTTNAEENSAENNNEINSKKYIISNETYPIKQYRFGFLPVTLQLFLNTDNSAATDKNNRALIKPETECILRFGVEQIRGQSFLGCFAELYKYIHRLPQAPTVKDFKTILADSITLDKFIRYNNSYLISVFSPKLGAIDDDGDTPDISKYENTFFYKTIDVSNENQRDFLEHTVAAYENFINYLLKDDVVIDHTYLWDCICEDNPTLIRGGINLIILEIVNNDITENIKLICPTNSSHRIFDVKKPAFILLKREDTYEPIYVYKKSLDGEIYSQRVFNINDGGFQNIQKILRLIQKTGKNYCAALPSMPSVYKFKKNIPLRELISHINETANRKIVYQILNYQSKIIGVVVTMNNISAKLPTKTHAKNYAEKLFIPCLPSGILPEYAADIPLKYIDDPHINIWNDYRTTVEELTRLHESAPEILCSPKIKVVEDNLIIGILTETNQFIQIDPPSENIEGGAEYELPEINSSNFIIADKKIALSGDSDKEREQMIKRIALESKFYSVFRTLVRETLNNYENRDVKAKLEKDIINNEHLLYDEKLVLTKYLLKTIMKHKVSFQEIDDKLLYKIDELTINHNCQGKTFPKAGYIENLIGEKNASYCIQMSGIGKGEHFIIPHKHLISGVNNVSVYFTRIADEIVRYNRIRVFMLNTQNYLNITNTEYKLNKNEFILIQSSIENNYLKNLVPFNVSSNINNINFDNAIPQINQPYSNELIKLKEQRNILEDNEDAIMGDKLESDIIACIEDTIDIIGQPRESLWKRVFSDRKYKEIVFKNTTTNCSFYVLIYIFQKRYNMPISVLDLKKILFKEYNKYLADYKRQILKVLRIQGKKDIAAKIEKNIVTFETAIMSEEYYLTDLDIWLFCEAAML